MTREIKFRAWVGASDDKRMSAPFYVIEGERNLNPFFDEPLMQFTGLLDKNGKEIYEGDVVKFVAYEAEMQPTEYAKVPVIWFDSAWWIGGGEYEYGDKMSEFISDELEIIGNIYEN